MSEWRTDKPKTHGYYLATWEHNDHRYVSELWFNPSSGWFPSRAYLLNYAPRQEERIGKVLAWMDMPKPYEPDIETSKAIGGTFTLTGNGKTTAPIDANATREEVAAAIVEAGIFGRDEE